MQLLLGYIFATSKMSRGSFNLIFGKATFRYIAAESTRACSLKTSACCYAYTILLQSPPLAGALRRRLRARSSELLSSVGKWTNVCTARFRVFAFFASSDGAKNNVRASRRVTRLLSAVFYIPTTFFAQSEATWRCAKCTRHV